MTKEYKYDNEIGSAIIDIILAIDEGLCETMLEDTATFSHDLGLDSIGIPSLVVEMEKRFDITIPYEETECIKTVGDLKVAITKLKTQQSAKEVIK